METKRSQTYSFRFLNPWEIIKSLGVSSGMSAAHFGSGNGYFTFPLAKKVGLDGIVYALDIIKERVEAIARDAKVSGVENILAKQANLEKKNGSGLENESVDWIFIVNMLFQNEKKSPIIREATRVLKPGGKIFIVEWDESDVPVGPKKDARVSKGEIIKIARKYNLGVEKEMKPSDFHFALVLKK